MTDARRTWIVVDGENIDATLGGSILERRPQGEERPRWNRVVEAVERRWGQPASGVFFLNATQTIPAPFVQALRSLHYEVVLLSGAPDQKVVDIAVQRTLRALVDRPADVVLVSGDGDFVDDVRALATDGRRVAVAGFTEFRSAAYSTIPGIELLDLEDDIGAFDVSLPRLRVIPVDEFDPASFLDRTP